MDKDILGFNNRLKIINVLSDYKQIQREMNDLKEYERKFRETEGFNEDEWLKGCYEFTDLDDLILMFKHFPFIEVKDLKDIDQDTLTRYIYDFDELKKKLKYLQGEFVWFKENVSEPYMRNAKRV